MRQVYRSALRDRLCGFGKCRARCSVTTVRRRVGVSKDWRFVGTGGIYRGPAESRCVRYRDGGYTWYDPFATVMGWVVCRRSVRAPRSFHPPPILLDVAGLQGHAVSSAHATFCRSRFCCAPVDRRTTHRTGGAAAGTRPVIVAGHLSVVNQPVSAVGWGKYKREMAHGGGILPDPMRFCISQLWVPRGWQPRR
jgi:hypothetical protein